MQCSMVLRLRSSGPLGCYHGCCTNVVDTHEEVKLMKYVIGAFQICEYVNTSVVVLLLSSSLLSYFLILHNFMTCTSNTFACGLVNTNLCNLLCGSVADPISTLTFPGKGTLSIWERLNVPGERLNIRLSSAAVIPEARLVLNHLSHIHSRLMRKTKYGKFQLGSALALSKRWRGRSYWQQPAGHA